MTLFITANDNEREAFLSKLENQTTKTFQGGVVCKFGSFGKYEIAHYHSRNQGVRAETEIKSAIKAVKPRFVILVGIACAGLDINQRIGDVLVSKRIMDYNERKEGCIVINGEKIKNTILRGEIVPCGDEICGLFHGHLFDWENTDKIKVYFGDVISSGFLLNNSDVKEDVFGLSYAKSGQRAVGYEMEGSPAFWACHSCGITELIVIKGISDFGDGTKNEKSEEEQTSDQRFAAENAVSLCHYVFSQSGIATDNSEFNAEIYNTATECLQNSSRVELKKLCDDLMKAGQTDSAFFDKAVRKLAGIHQTYLYRVLDSLYPLDSVRFGEYFNEEGLLTHSGHRRQLLEKYHLVEYKSPIPNSTGFDVAYLSHAVDLVPKKLLQRESELKLLSDIFYDKSGYVLFSAEAYSGKSSLLSWFLMHPPKDAWIIGYFIVGRIYTQSDSDGFKEALMAQLANYSEDIQLGGTQDLSLYDALSEVADNAFSAEKKLVLIVDALDEDMSASRGKPSVLSLLPDVEIPNLVVILSSRPKPNIQELEYLRDEHPIKHCPVYTLRKLRISKDFSDRARAELTELCLDNQVWIDAVSLMAVSHGALSVNDLSELTQVPPEELTSIFENVNSRLFLSVARAKTPLSKKREVGYMLGHATLQEQALREFVKGDEKKYIDRLNQWADAYRKKRWPLITPAYLLADYLGLLTGKRQFDRLVEITTDPDYISAVTGMFNQFSFHTDIIDNRIDSLYSRPKPDLYNIALLREQAERFSRTADTIPDEVPGLLLQLGHEETATAVSSLSDDHHGYCYRRSIALAKAHAKLGNHEKVQELIDNIMRAYFEEAAYTDDKKGRWSTLDGPKECFGILAECDLYLHLELKFLELLKEINSALSLGVLANSDWICDLILAQVKIERYDMAVTMYKHLESIATSLHFPFLETQLKIEIALNKARRGDLAGLTADDWDVVLITSSDGIRTLCQIFELAAILNTYENCRVRYSARVIDTLDRFIEPLAEYAKRLHINVSKSELISLHHDQKFWDTNERKLTTRYPILELYKAIAAGQICGLDNESALHTIGIIKNLMSHESIFKDGHIDRRNYQEVAVLEALAGNVSDAVNTLATAPYDKMSRDHKLEGFAEMVNELWKCGRIDDAKMAFDGAMESEYEFTVTEGKHCGRGMHFFSEFAGYASLFYDADYYLKFLDLQFHSNRERFDLMRNLANSCLSANKPKDAELILQRMFQIAAKPKERDYVDFNLLTMSLTKAGLFDTAGLFLERIVGRDYEKYHYNRIRRELDIICACFEANEVDKGNALLDKFKENYAGVDFTDDTHFTMDYGTYGGTAILDLILVVADKQAEKCGYESAIKTYEDLLAANERNPHRGSPVRVTKHIYYRILNGESPNALIEKYDFSKNADEKEYRAEDRELIPMVLHLWAACALKRKGDNAEATEHIERVMNTVKPSEFWHGWFDNCVLDVMIDNGFPYHAFQLNMAMFERKTKYWDYDVTSVMLLAVRCTDVLEIILENQIFFNAITKRLIRNKYRFADAEIVNAFDIAVAYIYAKVGMKDKARALISSINVKAIPYSSADDCQIIFTRTMIFAGYSCKEILDAVPHSLKSLVEISNAFPDEYSLEKEIEKNSRERISEHSFDKEKKDALISQRTNPTVDKTLRQYLYDAMRGKDWIELADLLAIYDPETLDKLAKRLLPTQLYDRKN